MGREADTAGQLPGDERAAAVRRHGRARRGDDDVLDERAVGPGGATVLGARFREP